MLLVNGAAADGTLRSRERPRPRPRLLGEESGGEEGEKEEYRVALADEPTHVSELARRLGLSRPLLYMHLRRLEEAGYLAGHLELSADGKALKYFDVVDFSLTIDLATITDAVARSPLTDGPPTEAPSGEA